LLLILAYCNQARRQDFAEGGQIPQGATFLKYNIGLLCSNRGTKYKMGHRFWMGPGHHCPSAGDGPDCNAPFL